MFFSEKEDKIIGPLFEFIDNNPDQKYRMVLQDDTVLIAHLDTCYETENGLEEDEDKYEEFFACLFIIDKIISIKNEEKNTYKVNEFLEITYHNCPKSFTVENSNL